MKDFNTILNGILVLALTSVFSLPSCSSGNKTADNEVCVASDYAGTRLPLAYIRTDSLLTNYNFSRDMNESLMKDVEDQRLKLGQRQQKLQKDVEEFQRKSQMNAYLTQERAQQEYNRLARQEEELRQFAATIQEEFARKQAVIQQQLQDTILSQIKTFNTPKKYEMIFSNIGSDNFFYIDESYDITQEIIEFLNAHYKPTDK
ncbi:MAG: OmpH family outer membrane protein [Dysgonamonadaceae bacterium]|jgi:outer membrane protein|nr:OmpH family outer membrane protein [Dysgonamonadaceae bacterium]